MVPRGTCTVTDLLGSHVCSLALGPGWPCRRYEQSLFLGQAWEQLGRVKSPWAGWVQEPQHGATLALHCEWL